MDINWVNGKSATWKMEYKDGVLVALDGGLMTIAPRMTADFKLNGQFAAGARTENVSNTQTFRFKKDGTFTVGDLGSVQGIDESAQAVANRSGIYSISGNTLVLQFASGLTTRSVIIVQEIGGKEHLIINRRSYSLE